MPDAWFRMKVFQLWEDGRAPLTIYLATVDCAITIPSFSSSPWIAAQFVHDHMSKLLTQKPEVIEGPVQAHD